MNCTDVKNEKGIGNDCGRQRHEWLVPNLPLDWDRHLKKLSHAECMKEDYPDLALNFGERMKLRSIRRMEKMMVEEGV